MPSPIPTPLVNGYRHSIASVELKLAGQQFLGFTSIDYSRTRNRELIRGAHPDPLGKTRGENEYKCSIELYFAEFMLFLRTLKGDSGGVQDGYGDVFFDVTVTYGESWFDTVTDEIIGCTLDTTEASIAKGTDGLVRKFEVNPVKIKFAQVDDLEFPLAPVAGG